jgi:hypothetical protein
MAVRRIVIAAFPEVQSLDVVGPAEVFSTAGAYRVEVVLRIGSRSSCRTGCRSFRPRRWATFAGLSTP